MESCPPFEVLEFILVVRGSVKSTTLTLCLGVLDSTELVSAGVLEVALVWFCWVSCVLPVHYSGLVDSFKDLAIPLRLSTPIGNLSPRGRYIGDICELGREGVYSLVNLSRGVQWSRGEVKSLCLSGD